MQPAPVKWTSHRPATAARVVGRNIGLWFVSSTVKMFQQHNGGKPQVSNLEKRSNWNGSVGIRQLSCLILATRSVKLNQNLLKAESIILNRSFYTRGAAFSDVL